MKKYIVFFAVLFFATIANAQPKLEIVGGSTYDWGKSNPAQSPLKTIIKIKNAGTEVLKIAEVKPGCGCTNAPLDKYEIQPNDFASMEVSLNISSYTGEITKSIRITSNDPKNGDAYVFLKTNVFRPLIVEPSTYLGKSSIDLKKEVTFDFQLKNQTDKPIKINGTTLSPTYTITNIKKDDIIPANQTKSYVIKLTPKEVGRLNGSLKIQTDNKLAEEVTIYFYGNVVDAANDKNTNK